jgi:heme/copper-type cytochrome/quinol oxidase subunit 2
LRRIVSVLAPASPISSHEAWLYRVVPMMALAVFIIVEGLLICAAIRFRSRKGDDGLPAQVEGGLQLEFIWIAILVVLVVALFVMSLSAGQAVAVLPPSNAGIRLDVIGYEWWGFNIPILGLPAPTSCTFRLQGNSGKDHHERSHH